MASFDGWRAQYFSTVELADPAISGMAATPDGDRVPNLLKYYLGLPGRAPVLPDSLPKGSLLSVGGQLFAALSWMHDKSVTDVDCQPEISSDLTNWLSGPGFIQFEPPLDAGALEELTAREITPLGGAPPQFMRLMLQPR